MSSKPTGGPYLSAGLAAADARASRTLPRVTGKIAIRAGSVVDAAWRLGGARWRWRSGGWRRLRLAWGAEAAAPSAPAAAAAPLPSLA